MVVENALGYFLHVKEDMITRIGKWVGNMLV